MTKKASMGTKIFDSSSSPEKAIWVTDFNDEALKEFYVAFTELEENPLVTVIPIIISSYGGEVDSLIAMRDLIKSSVKPVATICMGKAMSCGAFLLAAGTAGYRFISQDSTVMVHEVSAGAYGKTAELKNSAEAVERLNTLMMKRFSEDTGNKSSKILTKLHRRKNTDWFMGAEEAISNGIADVIGIPRVIMENPQFMLAVGDQNLLKKRDEAFQAAKKKAKRSNSKGKLKKA
jgi:ATP-dependent Clp protease, protease subunit